MPRNMAVVRPRAGIVRFELDHDVSITRHYVHVPPGRVSQDLGIDISVKDTLALSEDGLPIVGVSRSSDMGAWCQNSCYQRQVRTNWWPWRCMGCADW
jgi:hypothetical protein